MRYYLYSSFFHSFYCSLGTYIDWSNVSKEDMKSYCIYTIFTNFLNPVDKLPSIKGVYFQWFLQVSPGFLAFSLASSQAQ